MMHKVKFASLLAPLIAVLCYDLRTPDGSTIVGLYTDLATGLTHGYLLENGNFQRFDVPGSNLTRGWDINPDGQVVGDFRDITGKFHGFLRTASGYTTIDFPGAALTRTFGINPSGAIVGQYIDTTGKAHGFLAVPSTQE